LNVELSLQNVNTKSMYGNPSDFGKNFRLGTELQMTGRFIYNALYLVDQIEYCYHYDEVVVDRYSVSIGLERLEKIVLILSEHNEEIDEEEFEEKLKTHHHVDLLKRIKTKHTINLGKQHVKLLQFISDFYNRTRYSRYNLNSVYEKKQDLHGFVNLLKEELKVTEEQGIKPMVANSIRVKKFIGKLVGKITTELYQLVHTETTRLKLFTHELEYYSKAYKIFMAKEFTFENERH